MIFADEIFRVYAESLVSDVDSGIMVSVMMYAALRASPLSYVHSNILIFICTAGRTAFLTRRKPLIYCHKMLTLFFELVLQEFTEHTEPVIMYGPTEIETLRHILHIQCC